MRHVVSVEMLVLFFCSTGPSANLLRVLTRPGISCPAAHLVVGRSGKIGQCIGVDRHLDRTSWYRPASRPADLVTIVDKAPGEVAGVRKAVLVMAEVCGVWLHLATWHCKIGEIALHRGALVSHITSTNSAKMLVLLG